MKLVKNKKNKKAEKVVEPTPIEKAIEESTVEQRTPVQQEAAMISSMIDGKTTVEELNRLDLE